MLQLDRILSLKTLLGATALASLVALGPATASTVHLTASSPWLSHADPLSRATGIGLLPAIFDFLTAVDGDGTVRPKLALGWRNESDTVWTFDLRSDAVFNNGAPVDADAVAASLSVLIGPDGQRYGTAPYMDTISGVRALSKTTIEITTSSTDARLPRKLATVPIFSAADFHSLGRTEYSKSPVGSGPFTPESWSADGRSVVLRAVPSSWRPSKDVERVEISVILDPSARLQNLLSGGTDIANAIDPDQIPMVEAAGYEVAIDPGPLQLGVALRTFGDANEALRDVRVRRALNYAVDRETIANHLLLGTMPAAVQFATPGVLGFDPEAPPLTYDPERARSLMADAGYASGFDMIWVVNTGQFPGDTLIFQQVVQDLSDIGVGVTLRTTPVSDFIRRINSQDWEGVDAYSTVVSHYRYGDISQAAERFSCYDSRTSYCDASITDLIIKSNETLEAAGREQLLKDINTALLDQAPALLIVQYASINALSNRITSFPTATGNIMFERMEIDDTD